MKVYVVACTDIPENYKTVSQEAYSTLEKAQNFCESRNGIIKKINDYTYVSSDKKTGYNIVEVSIV